MLATEIENCRSRGATWTGTRAISLVAGVYRYVRGPGGNPPFNILAQGKKLEINVSQSVEVGNSPRD